METMQTILWQVVTMILLAAVGYLMYKSGKISHEGSKTLGTILIFLSLPCVIINSFLVERTPERITGFFVSALMAALVLALSMLLSRLILGRHAVENFAGSFANPGFFGVPLIIASVGSGGVFYIAAFIAFLNLLQWTYGVSLLTSCDSEGMLPIRGNQKEASKVSLGKQAAALGLRLIKAPFMIAILVGAFFFLTGISMPAVLQKCVANIAGLNTSIAMFTIGIYMAQVDILKMFLKPRLYLVSLVRMIIIPAVTMGLLLVLPASMNDLKLSVLIAAACPVGSNVAVYAQLHNRDYGYAVETVVISTLLSIVTLPMVVGIAERLF